MQVTDLRGAQLEDGSKTPLFEVRYDRCNFRNYHTSGPDEPPTENFTKSERGTSTLLAVRWLKFGTYDDFRTY
jgi:hypothetical protein